MRDLYSVCQRLRVGTPYQIDVILYSGSCVRCWWYWLAQRHNIPNLIIKKV